MSLTTNHVAASFCNTVLLGGNSQGCCIVNRQTKYIHLDKSLFVVPNHLTEQWATEYLQLYPSANILVATNKDFETKNRKRFCGRIATGDYDAIIIGHSQFEKVPMSVDRQIAILRQQRKEILDGIRELKEQNGDHFSRTQMLSNSEFVVMLNQAASDREKLARLLNISSEQMSYITNADAGCGLIKYGSALVPFVNRFPP